MKVEERIERAKTQGRLSTLLQLEPLDRERILDFESVLVERCNELLELTQFLATSLATAQQALIRQQEQIIVQQGAIETLANIVGAEQADKGSGLVGFDKPKIELN